MAEGLGRVYMPSIAREEKEGEEGVSSQSRVETKSTQLLRKIHFKKVAVVPMRKETTGEVDSRHVSSKRRFGG